MDSIPLFKSHYSLGKSILTLSEVGKSDTSSPDSIFDICQEEKIPSLFLVEENMSGFLEAYTNCNKQNISLHFGLRLKITNDLKEKSEKSFENEHHVIIFIRTSEGYKDLIKIYSKAATDGFYYYPRMDWPTLKEMWPSNPSLKLVIPFYDSFIYQNALTFASIIPSFFTKPTFFIENNGLPFDDVIQASLRLYNKQPNFPTVAAKSIYYRNRRDFKTYLTFRCINNRSSLQKPNLEHMSSDKFCAESWREQNVL